MQLVKNAATREERSLELGTLFCLSDLIKSAVTSKRSLDEEMGIPRASLYILRMAVVDVYVQLLTSSFTQ